MLDWLIDLLTYAQAITHWSAYWGQYLVSVVADYSGLDDELAICADEVTSTIGFLFDHLLDWQDGGTRSTQWDHCSPDWPDS